MAQKQLKIPFSMKSYLTTVFVPVCDFEKRKSVRQMSLSLNQLGVLFQTEHHNESRSHAKTRKREKSKNASSKTEESIWPKYKPEIEIN